MHKKEGDRAMSTFMGPEWVKEQQARADRMNELYEMDERSDDPDHPMHGLFTGLHQEVLIYEKWKKQFGLEI